MFKPMLITNDVVDLDKIQFPQYASIKRNGVRVLFQGGEMLTRKLKPVQNRNLHKKFNCLKTWSKNNPTKKLEGEFYCHGLPLRKISGIVRSHDKEVPEGMKVYAFDLFDLKFTLEIFSSREARLRKSAVPCEITEQILVIRRAQVDSMYKNALEDGYEGLVLKNPNGVYKQGRTTIKENLAYKLKPYQTFDCKIIDILQATVVDPKAPKKRNELGRSVTSKKKGDRLLIEQASAFRVRWGKKDYVDVPIGRTEQERRRIWNEGRKCLIGTTIEFKGLMVDKGKPQHPVFIDYREDK